MSRNHELRAKSHQPDFKHYREIAPESVSDDRLKEVLKSFVNDDISVKKAIEAMWNDIPDSLAVSGNSTEWMSTGKKPKKKSDPLPERGGRGRGRSVPARGGPGRGSTGGRSSSTSGERNSIKSQLESIESKLISNKQTSIVENIHFVEESLTNDSKTQTVNNTTVLAWGSGGLNLAQKLKLSEEQAKLPAKVDFEEIEESKIISNHSSNVREKAKQKSNKKDKPNKPIKSNKIINNQLATEQNQVEKAEAVVIDSLSEDVIYANSEISSSHLEVQDVMLPEETFSLSTSNNQQIESNPNNANIAVNAGKHNATSYLNLGRFEKVEDVQLTFGSFSFTDNNTTNHDSQPEWSNVEDSQNLVTDHDGLQSQDVWNNTNISNTDVSDELADNNTFSNLNSYHQNQNQADQRFIDKQSAPPGLSSIDVSKNNRQNRRTENQPSFQQPPVYYQQQAVNVPPPGMPNQNLSQNQRNNVQNNISSNVGPVYGYGLDGMVYGQLPYNSVPPLAPNNSTNPSVNPSNSANSGSAPNPNVGPQSAQSGFAPAPPGMGQMGAYPPPYYPNPYPYQGYYPYNAQGQTYYGRGQGMYQPPRGAYGADPYIGQGMGGYGDIYGTQSGHSGQFGDGMYAPMGHQQVPHQAQNNQNGNETRNNKTKNQSNASPLPANNASNLNADVGHYPNAYGNPYLRDQNLWPYQQNPAQWNAQMMQFSQTNPPVGYVPGTSQVRHDTSRGSTFGNRAGGASTSSTGGATNSASQSGW